MPVTYDMAVKTARITATRDHFANGTIELQDATNTPIAIFGLTASGGTITDDTWTFAYDATTVNAVATGVITKAVVKDSLGNAHITGLTVGEGSGDISVDNADINVGQEVKVNSGSLQHA